MSDNTRDLLDLLKFELRFLEEGGYGRSPHAPRRPPQIFEDSLSCINFNSLSERVPCDKCRLMQFVPQNRALEAIPCRHIPLDASGRTLSSLYETATQQEIEEVLGNWLRATIQRLERERAAASPPETSSRVAPL